MGSFYSWHYFLYLMYLMGNVKLQVAAIATGRGRLQKVAILFI